MKRHPLDALTVIALVIVLVPLALWTLWYVGWEPGSYVLAAPLLLIAIGGVGVVATVISARRASRRPSEPAGHATTGVTTDATTDADPTTDTSADDDTDTDETGDEGGDPPHDPTRTLTLEDLTGSSTDREEPR